MAEVIHDPNVRVISRDGASQQPVVVGEQQADGTWHGWIEFNPAGGGSAIRTGRETTQISRGALEAWASGLEATYYESAFERATPLVRT